MKLSVGAFSLLFAAGAAMAGADFPYADSLTQRYSLTGPTTISSFETKTNVPKVEEGMLSSEHVAVITADVANFTAADSDDWDESMASALLTGIQASLSMKYGDNDQLTWMGYTASGWVPLTGVMPTEGAWSVKIEIDYSVSPSKVRYSVCSGVEANGTYVELTPTGASDAWLQLGGTKSVVTGIDLLGYGTVNNVSGDCAARPFSGTVTTTESFNMQYEKLKVNVSVTGAWGDTAKVTLKKDGVPVEKAVVYGAVTDGACNFDADFTGKTVVGEDYTYDVEFLKGGETGTKIGQADTSEKSVKLYSEIDWFGFKEGAFEKATFEGIAINETARTFASADDEIVGNINPEKVSDDGAQTTVETEVIVAGVSPIVELPTEDGQQFAVSLATVNGVRKWAYRVGSGDWTAPTIADLATENGTYEVKVTFDYRDKQKTGTCWVKPAGGDYVELVTGFTLTTNKLAGTSVLGGDVGYMNASFKTVSPAPVVPKNGKIEMNGSNVKVDLAQASEGEYAVDKKSASGYLSWKDAGGKYATLDGSGLTVKTGTPANGLSSYESYLLGLDPDKADSKPIVQQVQNNDANRITFKLPGLSPKPESVTGVAVSYDLLELATPKAETGVSTPFTDGNTVTVDLPASGAKYYKVNIKTTK